MKSLKYLAIIPVFALFVFGSDVLGFVPHRPPPVHAPIHIGPTHVGPVHSPPVYRPNVVSHPPVVVRPPAIVHPAPAIHAPYVSRGIYVNTRTGIYRPGYAYYQPWHSGWHHGYWHGWYIRPWIGGIAIGWMYPPFGAAVYFNPYFIAPIAPVVVVYDYSQPIVVPAPVLVPSEASYYEPVPTADEKAIAAGKWLDNARTEFRAGNYDKSQQSADQAVHLTPGDSAAHEFRALAQFARGRYADAAAAIHSVLAVGPGWDWQTLHGLYPDTETYTRQLRALEAFTRTNPKDAASQFLLAYHYLVIDARDAAAKMLHSVISLQPKDQLAAHLLQMLEPKAADRPTPGIGG